MTRRHVAFFLYSWWITYMPLLIPLALTSDEREILGFQLTMLLPSYAALAWSNESPINKLFIHQRGECGIKHREMKSYPARRRMHRASAPTVSGSSQQFNRRSARNFSSQQRLSASAVKSTRVERRVHKRKDHLRSSRSTACGSGPPREEASIRSRWIRSTVFIVWQLLSSPVSP